MERSLIKKMYLSDLSRSSRPTNLLRTVDYDEETDQREKPVKEEH